MTKALPRTAEGHFDTWVSGGCSGEQKLSEASASTYLISTLTTLAADARDQIAWLDRYRLETDDLALDYENAGGTILVLAETGRIDAVVESRLSRIDATIDAMNGPAHAARWTYEALTTDAGWLTVRRLGREAQNWPVRWQQPMPALRAYSGP
ncbi:hypothetical protein [Streptomyces brasiliensis]|uniref:Uncharacterized protein n=1 Tax=Streptomyces brasiliensis TaxID=1954 RepID=A0A917LD42_9ACTN|nr:hypothetical protein [Streptomyces brasiliensis]GGJ54537.1 hypothetical protein GCM10010121_076450 [Streptomyces brasiliensis]